MCGIVAIVSFDSDIDEAELNELKSTVVHRGPDDSGVYLDNQDKYAVALGHTRLSIIDPSHSGHQPMGLHGIGRNAEAVTEDSKLCTAELLISYNGEIYNFEEIRQQLVELGWTFQSGSDTEVLLKGFAEWGEDLLQQLIGMYSFAVYDRVRKVVNFYRDFPGIKPLYSFRTGKRIYLASEVKSFARFELPIDEARVREYQSSKYIRHESLSSGVQCLEPGTCLSIDLTEQTINEYMFASLPSILNSSAYRRRAGRTEAQLIDDLDELLNKVVQDQMVADVPVGTICSGGIDSSLVTAIAARLQPDLKVFSLDVIGTSEIEYARIVSDYLGQELCEIPFDKCDFERLAATAAYYKDTPLVHPNSIAILKLSQAVKDNGVKVILSGEGADEVFGGYQKYIDYNRVLRLRHFLPGLNKSLIPLIADDNTLRLIVDHEVSPADLWHIWPTNDGRNDVQERLRSQYRSFGESRIAAELSSLISKDIQYYLNPLLRRADRMTMAVGIEGRVPMLDQRVIEFGVNLPASHKIRFFRGGKYLLKKVADRYLPKRIVWRKKKGLPLPVAEWTGVDSKLQQKSYFLDLWLRHSAGNQTR